MNQNLLAASIGAFLIAFVYLGFLRRMDVFEQEQPKYTYLVFGLGMICTFLLIPMQIFIPVQQLLPSEGNLVTRFIYHFFAVGLFEEFVKIIPFLIMLRFQKVMNESYDFIKYASVGALGFATIENVLYFNKTLHIIESRAFYTAILHMFTSSYIAYRFYFARILGGMNLFYVFIRSFFVAATVHALYNALMSSGLTFIPGIILVSVLLVIWGRMQNNLLNLSAFFNPDSIQNKVVLAGVKLLAGWALVFFYACGAIAWTENIEEAQLFFTEGILFGAGTGFGLYMALARPRIVQGKWFPLLSRNNESIQFIDNFDVRKKDNKSENNDSE
ncbi:MAG: PrsW family intramembrane metalloprotease [Bacteroidetes bacterium]|nr:PrsW family intramembrane metalloprotease [Bacteroidota bacterium]